MKKNMFVVTMLVLALIIATGAAMAYTAKAKPGVSPPLAAAADNVLTLSGHLVQTHVLKGSPGNVSIELILAAGRGPEEAAADPRGVDLVVVLDRSGSMQGAKLEHARQSLHQLLPKLTDRDRFALFSYSDAVQKHCDLLPVDDFNRGLMQAAVHRISANGATNL